MDKEQHDFLSSVCKRKRLLKIGSAQGNRWNLENFCTRIYSNVTEVWVFSLFISRREVKWGWNFLLAFFRMITDQNAHGSDAPRTVTARGWHIEKEKKADLKGGVQPSFAVGNGTFILDPPCHPSCVENPCCPACRGGWQQKWINLCEKDTGVKWNCHWLQVTCSRIWHKCNIPLNAARKKPWRIHRDVVRANIKMSTFSLSSSTQMPPLRDGGKDLIFHFNQKMVY